MTSSDWRRGIASLPTRQPADAGNVVFLGTSVVFLPMISAVTLSRGAAQMARQKMIAKHLEAVLDRHPDPFGQVSERPFTGSPSASQPRPSN